MHFPITVQRRLLIVGALSLCAVLIVGYIVLHPKAPTWVTVQVETGPVAEMVSVSGVVEAKNTAQLSFQTSGKVTQVFVHEGQEVKQGEILATLASEQLVAERESNLAELKSARAQYEQTAEGESTQTRAIAEVSLLNAEQSLSRTIQEEQENVLRARKALLSSGLIAQSTDINTNATPPTITGTYECENEGEYTLSVYNSNAYSGYSFRFEGLETGIGTAGTEQQGPLGSCGLYLQFTADESYGGTTWTIAIPNKQSDLYIKNANEYTRARTVQKNNIAKAEDALALAKKQTAEVVAGPRSAELIQALATIEKAEAQIVRIDSQIKDRSIVAPFDGTITDVLILGGEIAPLTPVITLLAANEFELKARILERDITKIQNGQTVAASFDARPQEMFTGKVTYVSPLATSINGVGYFESTVTLDTVPSWIKSGFNADMDITTNRIDSALRIPTQFLVTNSDGVTSVFTQDNKQKATTTISVRLRGTDGFTAVEGLSNGQVIIAP